MRIHMQSIGVFLSFKAALKDNIPERRANPKTCILAAVMMLIMVSLQSLEPSHLNSLGVEKVKEVVTAVVECVSDQIS